MRKGEITRNAVIDRALAISTQVGLSGLSIGKLATELSLSKSGLFAHFQSKEALDVAVVGRAAEIFAEVVVIPALKAKPGEPRLRALFENWIRWPERAAFPGGCFFIATASELDDRDGPAREALATQMRALENAIVRITEDAVRLGQFRKDVDPHRLAFEAFGIVFSLNQSLRLLRDPRAFEHARGAFDSLVLRSRA